MSSCGQGLGRRKAEPFVAHARDLSARRIEEIGPKLARAARELREGLGIAGGESSA